MSDLHVAVWGKGEKALLVHQSVFAGNTCWVRQRPLAERWQLLVPDRRGYGKSPEAPVEDLERDALDLADLLDEHGPIHLAGVSAGGTVALMAAARRPELVRTLTLVEPSTFALAIDHPEVRELVDTLQRVYDEGRTLPAREFLVRSLAVIGGLPDRIPDPLPAQLERQVNLVRGQRRDWLIAVPVAEVAEAGFPTLVISGGHSPAFETVCDVLADAVGAGRAVIRAGHSVQLAGAPFNDRLERFWTTGI
ncbi:MAG: alpha/beta fold hydrolase [Candidatus Dormibacteria bacterium]